MRWNRKTVVPPKSGEGRCIKRFLFFPKSLGSETRWLEFVYIEQHWLRGKEYVYHQRRWRDCWYWKDIL